MEAKFITASDVGLNVLQHIRQLYLKSGEGKEVLNRSKFSILCLKWENIDTSRL